MTKPLRIINCAEISGSGWTFLRDDIRNLVTVWKFYSASDKCWLERIIKRPKIGRYRACFYATLAAKMDKADVMISHLPRTTLWFSLFAKVFHVKAKHLAFSFNFTELPNGLMKRLMSYAFQQVDRFVVFSNAEKELYSDYFHLDANRFDVLPWCMSTPVTQSIHSNLPNKFVCAVGGEGRDYHLLIEACRDLPDIPIVIIARPHNIIGLDIPPHITVIQNADLEEFWGIVRLSKFVAIPLLRSDTNCGHISIVGSFLLDKPVVSTFSSGTSDYLNMNNSLLSPAGDAGALRNNINKLWQDDVIYGRLSKYILSNIKIKHSMDIWHKYLETYLQSVLKKVD